MLNFYNTAPNRAFLLKVTRGTLETSISNPFRISFQCDKSIDTSTLNSLHCKIYGLAENTREMFHRVNTSDELIYVELSIGYDGGIKRIFKGEISTGKSTLNKEGFITSFDAEDGGYDYINSYTSTTVSGKDNAINAVLLDMPNINKGKITDLNTLSRPRVLMGNSSKMLEELTLDDESFFINDGKINIIKDDDVIISYIPLINADNGLLTTPEVEGTTRIFNTLLNPHLTIGGRLDLISQSNKSANGVCKVTKLNYIGDSNGQNWKQKVTCILIPDARIL